MLWSRRKHLGPPEPRNQAFFCGDLYNIIMIQNLIFVISLIIFLHGLVCMYGAFVNFDTNRVRADWWMKRSMLSYVAGIGILLGFLGWKLML